jgi:tetratricopeptide (TPR) repeat protein
MFNLKLKLALATLRALFGSALIAGCAGLLLAGSALAEEAKNEAKNTVSAKMAKPLKAAQDDLTAKRYSDAILKLKEVEGNPGKSPYDQHVINEMLKVAYVRTQNYADAARVMEVETNDGFVPPSEMQGLVRGLAQVNYQIKNYDKAIEFGNRAIKGGFADEELRTLVGQAYYLKGDWKGTLRFEEGLVDNQIKDGRTPKSEALQLILSSCVKLNDQPCETRALERVVTYYPKPDYWYQLLFTLRQQTSGNDANTLQTYRLMSEVDVLKNPDDYTEMAQLALEAGSPGEAQRILEKGIAKGVFADQRAKQKNERLLESAKKAAATDQASLQRIAKEADSAATGAKNAGLGLAYFGYGQYDKAVEELSKGLSKGGLRNESEARLLLGIAQLKAGHKEDAAKTFRAVKGDPALERLANLWTLHAKQA